MENIEKYVNKIINADCMDILKQLPDKCIDLVLTDPPYEMVSGGRGKGDLADRQINRNELFRKTGLYDGIKNDVLRELHRVMNKNKYIYFL